MLVPKSRHAEMGISGNADVILYREESLHSLIEALIRVHVLRLNCGHIRRGTSGNSNSYMCRGASLKTLLYAHTGASFEFAV